MPVILRSESNSRPVSESHALTVAAIDSRGVPQGQGQDFTITAIGRMSLNYDVSKRLTISGGALYQHFSNAGLSEPKMINTGLDTIGPTLSVGYRF